MTLQAGDITLELNQHQLSATIRDDLTFMVAGQGGDGSLTIISLLAKALLGRGYYVYQASNIASRIKGGHAAAFLRMSMEPRQHLGDEIDILVAFDVEAVRQAGTSIASNGVVIFDCSREQLPAKLLPDSVLLISVPFSRLSVRDLRLDLFKNSLGFGLLGRIMGLPDQEVEACLKARFKIPDDQHDHPNVQALSMGQAFAENAGISEKHSIISVPESQIEQERMFISGNHATALGFLATGGRFFAGYPITPATEIMDWLSKHFPAVGGITIQAEDELAAVNLAIGSSLTGVRTMTASSGPGIALMQESIGHCGSAEIPLVIVDCQRAGPSTGMPTKPEQSDINMLTRGGNGDYPRVVLAPGNPVECFEFSALATNLAQLAQCPIIIAQDAVCHDLSTVDKLDLDQVQIEQGKLLETDDVKELKAYRRYEITEDGISPWAVPGTPGAMNLVTGNERNEWGRVSTEPNNRIAMVDKRSRKIETIRGRLPLAHEWGKDNSEIGIVVVGIIESVVTEALGRLQEHKLYFHCHRPRTLWPVLSDSIKFINSHKYVYVIEQNESAQLAALLQSEGARADKIRNIVKYNGLPFSTKELVKTILKMEAQQ